MAEPEVQQKAMLLLTLRLLKCGLSVVASECSLLDISWRAEPIFSAVPGETVSTHLICECLEVTVPSGDVYIVIS